MPFADPKRRDIVDIECCRHQDVHMGSILIRNLDNRLKERLRIRAARNGRSMEEEARIVLRDGLEEADAPTNIVDLALRLFGPDHGIDLEPHPDAFAREPPDFG
jgi:plasmid stability protein